MSHNCIEAERFIAGQIKKRDELRSEQAIRLIQEHMLEIHGLSDWLPPIKLIPSLHKIVNLEFRLNSRVLAAVSTRPVVTIYELEREICLLESVTCFRDLHVGESLVHLPTVQRYFQLEPPVVVPKVTSFDFVWYVKHDANAQAILLSGGDAQSLMTHFAKVCGVSGNPRKAGVHIQSMEWLVQAVRSELAAAHQLVHQSEAMDDHVRQCKLVADQVGRAVLDHCLAGKQEVSIIAGIDTSALLSTLPSLASSGVVSHVTLQISKRAAPLPQAADVPPLVLNRSANRSARSAPVAISAATVVAPQLDFHSFAACVFSYSSESEKLSMMRAVTTVRGDAGSNATGSDFMLLQRLCLPLDVVLQQWDAITGDLLVPDSSNLGEDVVAYNKLLLSNSSSQSPPLLGKALAHPDSPQALLPLCSGKYATAGEASSILLLPGLMKCMRGLSLVLKSVVDCTKLHAEDVAALRGKASSIGLRTQIPLTQMTIDVITALTDEFCRSTGADARREAACDLLDLFFHFNETFERHEAVDISAEAPDFLKRVAWLPYFDERTHSWLLLPPSHFVDPSPKFLRLLQGIARFVPTRSPRHVGVDCLCEHFLRLIGVQCDPAHLSDIVLTAITRLQRPVDIPVAQALAIAKAVNWASVPVSDRLVYFKSPGCNLGNFVPARTVCWNIPPQDSDGVVLFDRLLEPIYGEGSRDIFTATIQVPQGPSLASLGAWLNTVRSSHEVPSGELLQRLRHSTEAVLSMLEDDAGAAALFNAAFPFVDGWHRPHEGVIFTENLDSDAFIALTGKPTRRLLLLPFASRPASKTKSLLLAIGLRDLRDVAKTEIAYDGLNGKLAAEVLEKLSCSIPFVQQLLFTKFYANYAANEEEVRLRLRCLSVYACQNAREVISLSTQVEPTVRWAMERRIHCTYVPSSGTLYVADEPYVTNVIAEAAAEMFFPRVYDAEPFEAARQMLQWALRSPDVTHEANTRSIPAFRGSHEATWTVPATSARRYRSSYPPEADGTTVPSLARKTDHVLPVSELWAGLDIPDDEDALRMIRSKRPRVELTPNGPPLHNADDSRAAEKFVVDKLRPTLPAGQSIVWVNEEGESGYPYDFIVVHEVNKVVMFGEVKSTTSASKRNFELTLRETLFAAKYGSRYVIYRVFNASKDKAHGAKMTFETCRDVMALWQRGAITLTADIKAIVN